MLSPHKGEKEEQYFEEYFQNFAQIFAKILQHKEWIQSQKAI